MNIFSIALNMHDHNTYDGEFHDQIERYSRLKHNLIPGSPHNPDRCREFFLNYFLPRYLEKDSDDILAFSCSNLGIEFIRDLVDSTFTSTEFLSFKPTNLWDRYQTDFYYIDHHQSHAAYAFLTSGFKESDILAIDGRGWHYTCIFVNKHGDIIDLSNELSIGGLWNRIAQELEFGYLGAGKVMGLAGYGKYNKGVEILIRDYIKNPDHKLSENASTILKITAKEDIAFTLQKVTLDLIEEHVVPLKTSKNICVAGGVAYNGYMNEKLFDWWGNVHVPPAAGDEGQALGTYMHADYVLNNNIHLPKVYAGADHPFDIGILDGLTFEELTFDKLCVEVADAISKGKIVGWYQGKSESGNRALGNRSILADPRNPDIKDIINSRVKMREDFRPFAPSVLEEHYQEYFDTDQPSPYMSRIVPVKNDGIPGVTHVDGTARIQTVTRNQNERYYDLISIFYKKTGIPMLLNTSFNCQEPVVEIPEDAVATFKKCGLDILVIGNWLITK